MKKWTLLLVLMTSLRGLVWADEGMWLPQLLQALNEKDMKAKGMKISASDIYSISKSSLKDAIVSFGGFCTAEVISNQGLILTNHHCGFDAIQNHSTVTNNYIRDGFWAYDRKQEIANPGLTATFIVRIDEVTKDVLAGVTASMSERDRQAQIEKNITQLRSNVKKEAFQDLFVRAFFEGNRYFLFVTETYKDVRLVGAPPSSIGNFGKDTDNWMWPRHTGDFSLFRIYAGKDNKPADYSPDNVPYVPKRSLKISLKGMKAGDFTMVFGFPGRTNQYLHSAGVKQTMEVSNPAKIAVREKLLSILDGYMRKDEAIKIQYAAKYASIQNYYKKWKGELLGLKSKDALGKKQRYEAELAKRLAANPMAQAEFGAIFNDIEQAYADIQKYALARDYYSEVVPRIELFTIASELLALRNVMRGGDAPAIAKRKAAAKDRIEDVFKEFTPQVDQHLAGTLLDLYRTGQDAAFVSSRLLEEWNKYGNDMSKAAAAWYANNELASLSQVTQRLASSDSAFTAWVDGHGFIQLYGDINKTFTSQVGSALSMRQANLNKMQRMYMKLQLDLMPERKFYPDANSTLRVTYGNVKGYAPRDGVSFDYYTYLDGILEKYIPGDYEFDVPAKLVELHAKKDYGRYGVKGKMPVCFIAANHTTGGNSGSPALDANGHLVGLNFDRVWEGTMSDINYDVDICRNIMVDVRYILFVIDKVAGAGHLVKEMELVL